MPIAVNNPGKVLGIIDAPLVVSINLPGGLSLKWPYGILEALNSGD